MKNKICDPACCGNCQYIGEGDFICVKDDIPVVVMSDWEPTDEYMRCGGGNNAH